MKLGTRVTISTTLLVASVLGLSGAAALRVRRLDLEEDLKREAREVADALVAGLEPLSAESAATELRERVSAARHRGHAFQLEILKVGTERVPDHLWATLVEAAEIDDSPVGFLEKNVPRPVYAMAVPLYDARGLAIPLRDPGRKAVAFVGVWRDTDYIEDEVWATARRTLNVFLGLLLLLGVATHVVIRTSVVQPLRRMLDGIDAVGKGDLSRVILAERDDEIGTLAGRFNAMTGSLREAREETLRGTEARLALETRLRQAEKLATIGQMAAEIAHEVGTPLNVIGGRARSMSRKAQDPAEVGKNASIIATQVDRIARIIRQVLDFSRKGGPTITKVDLGGAIGEAMEFLGDAIRRQQIRTVVRIPPALPTVPGDPDQIQQVCLNLLTNAMHAMPRGGTLGVTLERVMRRKEGLDLASPADYVMLEFADTGPGIAPENREKVFEPFFTTKDEGQGTGLGLAVSKGIVKDHDGWIEVDGRDEGGAVFRVYLPTGLEVAGSAADAGSQAAG